MKLKMDKSFNLKKAKSIFDKEFKFIQDLFSRAVLPQHNSSIEDNFSKNDENNKNSSTLNPKSPGKSRAQTFEELQSRVEQLRGNRGLDYRQKLMKKKLKNQLKKKNKRKELLMKKKLVMTERNAAGETNMEITETEVQKVPKIKPVFNSEGHMVFSKFDFKELGAKKRKLPKVEKDPKKILQQIKEKKEKIQELEESGQKEKAEEFKEKEAWKTALAKANGEKIKDDPELLKRSIKREEKQKKRSAKKWEARKESIQKSIQESQQKRQDNIMKRKKEKKTNKLKKAAKRGRIIPGF